MMQNIFTDTTIINIHITTKYDVVFCTNDVKEDNYIIKKLPVWTNLCISYKIIQTILENL